MTFNTADLCDQFCDEVQIVEPLWQDFGGVRTFAGKIVTIDTFEDNTLVREVLGTPGAGQVLVVDGGGSLRCALLGDQLAQLGADNGWSGIVIHGSVRDVEQLAGVAIGVKALACIPIASRKVGRGRQNSPLHFAGATFRPGNFLYADADGIIVANRDLLSE